VASEPKAADIGTTAEVLREVGAMFDTLMAQDPIRCQYYVDARAGLVAQLPQD